MLFKNRNRRSIPSPSNRRMSAITGSLTTNATGMPIIEAHPTRQRSSSLKGASLSFHQSLTLNRLFAQHQNNEKEHKDDERNEQTLFSNSTSNIINNSTSKIESNETKSELLLNDG